MSTASLSPSWKQEVNRRVAAHMSHKAQSAAEPFTARENSVSAASPAAQAARRVAARFLNAPSYSEILTREALAAARAAEAASKAAQEAHAAVQSVLTAVSLADADWDSQAEHSHDLELQAHSSAHDPQDPFGPTLVEEVPLFADAPASDQTDQVPKSAPARSKSRRRRQASNTAPDESQREPLWSSLPEAAAQDVSEAAVVEPIFANLIEFPREVVATRKMRPRRAEGPLAAFSSADQLSIFEVDPETVSTQPSTAISDGPAAPDWMRTKWANIELDEPARKHPSAQEELAPKTAQPAGAALVSLNRRLLALVVDGSLTLAAFVGFAALAVASGKAPMGVRTMEFVAAFALLAIAAGYQTLFFTLGNTTPGLWYAGVCLRTLRGERPTREQRRARLIALPLSVLPLGLGLIWALFDETHLTWHDRLSGTYLRKR